MLTSFFSKSKPVNIAAIVVFMSFFYVLANYREWFLDFRLVLFLEKLGLLLVYLFSLMILNFIARKNELTKRSSYKILLFAVFSASFFELLQNHQAILANLFLLLALRRIISLRSQKEMKKKIFDATFWICIASLFYFWSILFLVVVYAGLLRYSPNFKNWFIPPIAFLSVAAVTTSFHIIAYDNFYTFTAWFEQSSFAFDAYQDLQILIPLSFILALALWTIIFYLSVISKASVSMKPSLNLVLLSAFTAIAVAFFAPSKDGSELIFFFVPLSIIASTYFDEERDKLFREVLLALLILMPISLPLIF